MSVGFPTDDHIWVDPHAAEWFRLTERHVEVLCGCARGWGNQVIADHLGIALDTVKTHVRRMLMQHGLDGRVALVAWAYDSGILRTRAVREQLAVEPTRLGVAS